MRRRLSSALRARRRSMSSGAVLQCGRDRAPAWLMQPSRPVREPGHRRDIGVAGGLEPGSRKRRLQNRAWLTGLRYRLVPLQRSGQPVDTAPQHGPVHTAAPPSGTPGRRSDLNDRRQISGSMARSQPPSVQRADHRVPPAAQAPQRDLNGATWRRRQLRPFLDQRQLGGIEL